MDSNVLGSAVSLELAASNLRVDHEGVRQGPAMCQKNGRPRARAPHEDEDKP